MAANCPSCTRYIGPVDTCPYCHDTRLLSAAARRVRQGVIPLAVLLVFGMTLMAAQHPLPLVSGSDVTPLMNHARIRLEGVVRYQPQVRTEPINSIYIPVQSGNRLIRIKAYKESARRLAADAASLKRGSRIRATGSLSLSYGKDPVLYVDQLKPLD